MMVILSFYVFAFLICVFACTNLRPCKFVTALNAKLTSFEVRAVTVAYTCSENGQFNTNLANVINADLPSGYSVLGIVGFTTNNTSVIPVACLYGGGNYTLQLRNISGSSVSENASIRYLCAKLN